MRRLTQAGRRWLTQHVSAGIGALGDFQRRLTGNLMTTAVIGIALALPAIFILALDNLAAVTQDWDGTPSANIYLERTLSEADQQALKTQIDALPDITQSTLISAEEGRAAFADRTGMREMLALLETNPFPPVIQATPDSTLSPASVDALINSLSDFSGIEDIRLDQAWLQRLQTIVELASKATGLIGALLAIAVILVVGNTIRLDIENRRSEIQIMKLIGGTDAFVRRPFLYTGFWHGLMGGFLAWILSAIVIAIIGRPANRLAGLYDSGFVLGGPWLVDGFTIVAVGVFLGLLGAWVAVTQHLRRIEPGEGTSALG